MSGHPRKTKEPRAIAPKTFFCACHHASCEEFGLRRHARKWKSRGSILKENVPSVPGLLRPSPVYSAHDKVLH